MKSFYSFIFLLLLIFSSCKDKDTSVDPFRQQRLAQWQANKFGMFIHWGLYSIPAGVWKGEQIPFYAEQIMNHARIPVVEYEQLAGEFNPGQWNAEEVVLLAKKAGMRYMVFTTKHHDGFCMFKTSTTNYNVVDATPFGRDVVRELADACAKHGMKLGFYYSLPDWHFPEGIHRGQPDATTTCREHVNQLYSPLEIITPALEDYIVAQVTELLTNYGDIETIWFDMGLVTPAQSKRFCDTVRRLQPGCLINGRIMNHCGDYYTLTDNSRVVGMNQWIWDNPASMYSTWGYRSWQRRGEPVEQAQRQLNRLMNTVCSGGVFLLNIGPTGDGEVIPYEKEVLEQMGGWIDKNKEAIYDTQPSPFEQMSNAYCTQKDNNLYFTIYGNDSVISCQNLITPIRSVYLLEQPDRKLSVRPIDQGVEIVLPAERPAALYTVVAELTGSFIEVQPYYLSPANDRFILTEQNAKTHPMVDGTSYISMQPEAIKIWHLDIQRAGTYNLTIEYTPEYPDRTYLFRFSDSLCLKHELPGIDRWLQTSVVGTISLQAGKQDLQLSGADDYPILAPLGLKIKEIRLERTGM
jgi:alpha-L-fucosidase